MLRVHNMTISSSLMLTANSLMMQLICKRVASSRFRNCRPLLMVVLLKFLSFMVQVQQ